MKRIKHFYVTRSNIRGAGLNLMIKHSIKSFKKLLWRDFLNHLFPETLFPVNDNGFRFGGPYDQILREGREASRRALDQLRIAALVRLSQSARWGNFDPPGEPQRLPSANDRLHRRDEPLHERHLRCLEKAEKKPKARPKG